MRRSVMNRSYIPTYPFLQYLIRVDPLSPIVVADSNQPFVFSPNYAVDELSHGLVHYLSR